VRTEKGNAIKSFVLFTKDTSFQLQNM